MAKLCELKVSGKTNGTVVVANSILRGKVTRPVVFANVTQLKGALTLERAQIIKIHGELPSEAVEKLGEDGRNRFERQSYGINAEAPLEENVTGADFPTPSTENDPEKEDAQPEGNFPTPSLDKEEDSIGDDGKLEADFPTPSTENEDELKVGLTRSQIVELTAAELKAHIKANNLDIKGVSKMSAKDLKNAVLGHYELDQLSEEEAAQY